MSLTGNNGLLAAAGANQPAYSIDESLRFNDDDGTYLSKAAPGAAGNLNNWTISVWLKRGQTTGLLAGSWEYQFFSQGDVSANPVSTMSFYSSGTNTDKIAIGMYGTSDSNLVCNWTSDSLYRDYSAWYHVVVKWDNTQSAAADILKVYVNGEVVSGTFSTSPSQGTTTVVNKNFKQFLGKYVYGTQPNWWDGYMAEYHFIDGQSLTSASFGETNSDTNQWVPIEYAGTHGTQGWYLNFSDSSSLGADSSANSNNFTANVLAATDQVLDSPANNFATMNPLDTFHAGSSTFAEGNLKVSEAGGNAKYTQVGNFGMSSGKWYFEFCGVNSDNTWMLGVADVTKGLDRGYTGSAGDGLFVYVDGDKYAPTSASSYGVSWTHGDVMGVAVDMDNNAMYFAKNNTWMNSGVPTSGSTKTGAAYTSELVGKTWVAAMGRGGTNNTITATFNFGQDSSFAGAKTAQGNGGVGEDFFYTPPAGFKALNTDNLDDPSIVLPTEHFNTNLWTGTGGTRSLTGVGFQPVFTWIKSRSDGLQHMLFDSVRGATKYLVSDATDAEATDATQLTAFDSDGFSLGSGTVVNGTSKTFVGWNWKGSDTPTKTFVVTVTNPGSGNRYTLDGKVSGTNAMPITIEEGGTYTFDQSDNSNSGHPLRFSTTANGTHGGGSEYTTGVTVSGVPGNAGAKTVITVAAAAATLYFYCTAHSGMGAQASTPGSGGGVSNLSGTAPSVVNANTAAGFSIVKYTGKAGSITVGHGLSQAPEMIIAKNLDGTYFWAGYHKDIGNTKSISINDDGASYTEKTWNDTTPSASVFTLGASTETSAHRFNYTDEDFIAYCFHSVDGYIQVGKYTGSGATDGPFVYTGFRPAFIMVKLATAASGQWAMFDDKRDPDNPTDRVIYANLTNADTDVSSYYPYDLLSNGFKSRIPAGNGNEANYNTSGQTYLYLAFAQSPLKYANAR